MREGSVIRVATLPDEPGSRVEIRDVLLVSGDGKVSIGNPTVENAVVVAEVLEHGRGRKVVNFKYKAKVRYRRKRGHRQPYTALAVREILTDGAAPKETAASTRRRPRREAEPEAQAAEASVESAAPATEAPARRRTARKADEGGTQEAAAETKAPPRRRRSASAEEAKE